MRFNNERIANYCCNFKVNISRGKHFFDSLTLVQQDIHDDKNHDYKGRKYVIGITNHISIIELDINDKIITNNFTLTLLFFYLSIVS